MQPGYSVTGIQASIATKRKRKSKLGALILFSPRLLLSPEQLILNTVGNLEREREKRE